MAKRKMTRKKKIVKRIKKKLKRAFPLPALGMKLAPKPITEL